MEEEEGRIGGRRGGAKRWKKRRAKRWKKRRGE